ncbi:MAG: RluA family pseudouridine synthase [Bacteroidetes bacterium]|nr:RluA family pseudouridine synthase [Bacteroidota bacterium]
MHLSPGNILFENEDFIVINKPSGMHSIPDRVQSPFSLKELLKEKYGEIFTVHRIDKETSGVILFAKNTTSHASLSALFENREIEKYYLGLVHGQVEEIEGSIDLPIAENPMRKGMMRIHAKGKASLTDYHVIEKFRSYTWVSFRIHTGRTHQVRVHSAALGHPLVYDKLYGTEDPLLISSLKKNYHLAKKDETERPILSRLALHASSIHFDLNGASYTFEAPLPKDLKASLQQLRKWNQ